MIRSYQTKANLGIGVGLLATIGSMFVLPALMASWPGTAPSQSMVALYGVVRLVGTALFIYGCVMYALAKGRSGWWGAFGLLSLIGLIVLACLRDDAKDGYVAGSRGFTPVMRDPGGNPPRV